MIYKSKYPRLSTYEMWLHGMNEAASLNSEKDKTRNLTKVTAGMLSMKNETA